MFSLKLLISCSLFLVLAALTGLPAFSGTAPFPVTGAVSRIVVHLPAEPASLDWNIANRRIDSLVIDNLQEGLVELGKNHQILPDLAKSWEISSDGKTYTFHLKPNVVWSDGKGLSAQQFVDSWRRLLSPTTGTSNGYFLTEVVGAEDFLRGKTSEFSGVQMIAVDPLTVQLKLRRPVANWLWNFAQPPTFPVRQDLIDQYGAKAWATPGNLVTLGPYLLVSHDLDSEFVLRKNPKYFRAQTVNIGEIQYKILSSTAAMQAFITDKLDLVCYLSDVDRIYIPASAANPATRALPYLKWTAANTTKRIDFNTARFPLDETEVREAIALSINRKSLSESAGKNLITGTSAAPPSMTTYSSHSSVTFDPRRARTLILNAKLQTFPIEILVPMFDEHAEINLRTAHAVEAMLTQQLHADVTLQRAETEQLYTLLRDTKQYSLLIRDWTGAEDPDEFYSFYSSESKKSTTWSDPAYDKLVEQSRAEPNTSKRAKLYRQMDELLTEKAFAIVPLFYSADALLVAKRITGLDPKDPEPCKIRKLSAK